MLVLGVTGGIGSGKSAVAHMLEEHGARVFHADHEARRIMEENAAVRKGVESLFGPEAYLPGGSLNRSLVSARAFSNPEGLRRLNALVHPAVFSAFQEVRERALEDGVDVLVHEAALIFEAGAEKYVDAVVVVDAPEQVRIDRVVRRDGTTPEAVRARMEQQLPSEELRRRADFVIRNDGSLEDLRHQVDRLVEKLRTIARDGPGSGS